MKNKSIMKKTQIGIRLLKDFVIDPEKTYYDFIQGRFERKLVDSGIVTRAYISEKDLGIPLELDPNHYAAGGNIFLTQVLKILKIKENDTILDLGSGLGSAMIYMSKFPFKTISGLEYSKDLYEKCKVNLTLFNCQRLNIIFGDAGEFNCYDNYNYFFMANPFGKITMKKVINKILKSYNETPRLITIIYENPVHSDVISEIGIFKHFFDYKKKTSFKFTVYKTF